MCVPAGDKLSPRCDWMTVNGLINGPKRCVSSELFAAVKKEDP